MKKISKIHPYIPVLISFSFQQGQQDQEVCSFYLLLRVEDIAAQKVFDTFEKYKSVSEERDIQGEGFHIMPILLSGNFKSVHSLWANWEPVAKKKYVNPTHFFSHTKRVKNFLQYSSLYPEYKCVFIGDNGQGMKQLLWRSLT